MLTYDANTYQKRRFSACRQLRVSMSLSHYDNLMLQHIQHLQLVCRQGGEVHTYVSILLELPANKEMRNGPASRHSSSKKG